MPECRETICIEIAGEKYSIRPLFETTALYFRDYLAEGPAQILIAIGEQDLQEEQHLLDEEADREGLKRRCFTGAFLERSAIMRQVAREAARHDTLLLHGSTVSVDGKGYLFTAGTGTGKSTHTRLWRELLGSRAVMVNDDRAFIRLSEKQAEVFGSPWTGKHGLGCNLQVPLAGICLLERGSENRIRRVSAEEAIPELTDQVFLPGYDTLTQRLAELVPVWRMTCTKDLSAAAIAYEAMSTL